MAKRLPKKGTRKKTGRRPQSTRSGRRSTPRLKSGFVYIVTDRGETFALDFSDDERCRFLRQSAMQWAYSVRNRSRWLTTDKASSKLHERAWETLTEFGLEEDDISEIGRAKYIEIGIPYLDSDIGWEARIFPWEYVLSAAVRSQGERWRSLVMRHIQRPAPPPQRNAVTRIMIVTSNPGKLGDHYSFDSECELVETNCRRPEGQAPGRPVARHRTG